MLLDSPLHKLMRTIFTASLINYCKVIERTVLRKCWLHEKREITYILSYIAGKDVLLSKQYMVGSAMYCKSRDTSGISPTTLISPYVNAVRAIFAVPCYHRIALLRRCGTNCLYVCLFNYITLYLKPYKSVHQLLT